MKVTPTNLLAALLLTAAGSDRVTAQPLDIELTSSVDDGFTIATVGDLIISHSLAHLVDEPDFGRVVQLLSEADVATGNLETQIIDPRTFTGSNGGEPMAPNLIRQSI